MTRFLFITGGVASSLDKGIASASPERSSEPQRWPNSTHPGPMSPFQHGEVLVTEDGAETDLDLGHYERFVRTTMGKRNHFTTRRVYVIRKERGRDKGPRFSAARAGDTALVFSALKRLIEHDDRGIREDLAGRVCRMGKAQRAHHHYPGRAGATPRDWDAVTPSMALALSFLVPLALYTSPALALLAAVTALTARRCGRAVHLKLAALAVALMAAAFLLLVDLL